MNVINEVNKINNYKTLYFDVFGVMSGIKVKSSELVRYFIMFGVTLTLHE